MNSITCWKVERFVQSMVNGSVNVGGSGSYVGGKVIRTGAARHLLGSGPCASFSALAAVWMAAHSDVRQALRLPLPQ